MNSFAIGTVVGIILARKWNKISNPIENTSVSRIDKNASTPTSLIPDPPKFEPIELIKSEEIPNEIKPMIEMRSMSAAIIKKPICNNSLTIA